MSDNKRNARLDCNKKSQVDWNDITYPATVINLSVVGDDMHLCVHFNGTLPGVGLGEECGLRLLEEENNPCMYTARVIRVGASEIVVSILDMHRNF
ncbi:MAG: hypothetical protein ACOYL3_09055 [Desulfuromonadaceae bacterium]